MAGTGRLRVEGVRLWCWVVLHLQPLDLAIPLLCIKRQPMANLSPTPPAGTYRLEFEPKTTCWNWDDRGPHEKLFPVALLGIILYPLGIMGEQARRIYAD